MATRAALNDTPVTREQAASFERFAGLSGIAAGISGILYSIAFVFLKDNLLSGLFLLLSGLLAIPVLLALYQRLRQTEANFARLGLLLALIGTAGAIVHGGYDLANAINPPPPLPAGVADLPSQIDPRGLLTFGVTGLALFVLAWLMGQSSQFPKTLAYVGYALAVLLVVLYLGRLTILDAKNLLIVIPALLTGFIINPIWYVWLGLNFYRSRA